MFADLARVDLTGADFYWAMLNSAVLEGAIMARCDLRGADLREAKRARQSRRIDRFHPGGSVGRRSA
jgi:uncharacterized protein YjbI with pentapeptide repeats